MPTGSPTLDRDDIQGLVLRGYRMPEAVYLFYRFRDFRRNGLHISKSVSHISLDILGQLGDYFRRARGGQIRENQGDDLRALIT